VSASVRSILKYIEKKKMIRNKKKQKKTETEPEKQKPKQKQKPERKGFKINDVKEDSLANNRGSENLRD